jgi:acyl phosphate:glycerol-3-phosphate acyltransferase
MNPLFIISVLAYLLGSVPFGYILVKLFLKQDIRSTGSGNIGATNVARSGKKGLAIATLLLDAGKGALAVLLASAIISSTGLASAPSQQSALSIAALFSIIGHVFPVWLRFKGGKGVATAVGAFAVLSPTAVLVAVIAFVLIFAISRYVSLASIISAAVFPFAAYYLDPAMRLVAPACAAVAASLLIILKHHENLRRLISGTESRFGVSKDPAQLEKSI